MVRIKIILQNARGLHDNTLAEFLHPSVHSSKFRRPGTGLVVSYVTGICLAFPDLRHKLDRFRVRARQCEAGLSACSIIFSVSIASVIHSVNL